jgi:hypothetical protein
LKRHCERTLLVAGPPPRPAPPSAAAASCGGEDAVAASSAPGPPPAWRAHIAQAWPNSSSCLRWGFSVKTPCSGPSRAVRANPVRLISPGGHRGRGWREGLPRGAGSGGCLRASRGHAQHESPQPCCGRLPFDHPVGGARSRPRHPHQHHRNRNPRRGRCCHPPQQFSAKIS